MNREEPQGSIAVVLSDGPASVSVVAGEVLDVVATAIADYADYEADDHEVGDHFVSCACYRCSEAMGMRMIADQVRDLISEDKR